MIVTCVALLSAACGGSSAADAKADSVAAAAARQAAIDSAEAIQLANADTAIAPALGVDLAKMEKRPSGLYVLDKRRGSGAAADSSKWIEVSYTSWLSDGTKIDDTREKNEPRKVLLGHKQVVPAWEEGLRGMREGGRRLIVAPPSLGYGKAGKPGTVPRLATLVFDVELRKVY